MGLKSIPTGSKLVLNGDWYRKSGDSWHVVSYFIDKNRRTFRVGYPVEFLPFLVPGTVFPITAENRIRTGYTGTFKLPPLSAWKKITYSHLPNSLRRLHEYSDQIGNQVLFRIPSLNRIYWLPAVELARMLFFHSSEIVRAAVYQGNTWQLAKASRTGWEGHIRYSSNVPVGYMGKASFQKLFTWLLFDKKAEVSFASIFNNLNTKTKLVGVDERCTFDFIPPDLTSCEISWSGYTGRESSGEQDQCYIRQIRSIAGLTTPKVMTVEFSHPDDINYARAESNKQEDGNTESGDPVQTPRWLDPTSAPKATRRRHMIHIGPAGLHFDTQINFQRAQRQFHRLQSGLNTSGASEDEVSVGVTEACDTGSVPRADFDNLEEPDYMEASDKFFLFQSMLERLGETKKWPIKTEFGRVPRGRCRSLHLIQGRPRQYIHASFPIDDSSEIHCLEIELMRGECLSTLCFRADDGDRVVTPILDALMARNSSGKQKAMQWNRSTNTHLTLSRYYLEHPDRKTILSGQALDSWIERAVDKFLRL